LQLFFWLVGHKMKIIICIGELGILLDSSMHSGGPGSRLILSAGGVISLRIIFSAPRFFGNWRLTSEVLPLWRASPHLSFRVRACEVCVKSISKTGRWVAGGATQDSLANAASEPHWHKIIARLPPNSTGLRYWLSKHSALCFSLRVRESLEIHEFPLMQVQDLDWVHGPSFTTNL
jgi:hypothetical protein